MLKTEFPRVYQEIERQWGTKACRTYLTGLILDSRDGDRKGFPPAIAEEIIQILKVHDREFPNLDSSQDVAVGYSFGKAARPVVRSTGPNLFEMARYLVIVVLVVGVLFKFKKYFL